MSKNTVFKTIRPLCSAITLLIVVTSLTGCWSADEINDLATINVIGIDVNENGQVELTTVIAKPYTLFSETAVSGNEQNKFLIQTTTGESVFEAISDLSGTVSETLYFGHVDAIVFGEKAARERMVSALDFFKRGNDFRPNIKLLVTQGAASNLVKTMPQQNITLGLELEDLVISNRFSATGMVKDISQFMKDLSSDTRDPFTGVISVAEKKEVNIHKNKRDTKNQSAMKKSNQQNIPKALSLKGTAVFKDGHLKGFLNERETRGLLWIKGKLQNEIVVLSCGSKNGTASLTINDSESAISPRLSGNTPQMSVNIKAEADISQLTCTDINVDTELIDRLNQQLEERIRQEAYSALKKAKDQWQADIFGFGRAIYKNDPDEWGQMANDWRNGLLKQMDVEINVTANISRYGLLKDPIKANESR